MADVVEDIKARLDVVDLVSQYVQLKKTGRNYKACCPFHSEKTASFVVSPEKQIYHCFGCHKGGDIFTFIQDYEGVEFPEALQILADRAGLKVEKMSKFIGKEKKSEKDEYFKAHDLACEHFENNLYKTNDGKKVLEYLYKRGLKDETIKQFRLGFSVDNYDDLHTYLLKKGITKKVLMGSGFISAKNLASDKVYDKFRGRLMFPIFDYLGRVSGFGGRALKKDQMPKYLNSPENVIYNKSKILYGLYHSKQAVKDLDQIVLVEGYFDVLLPFQEGVKNVAAVSGTALTDGHTALIKRITSNVVTCFDHDSAGFDATKRSASLLLNEKMLMKTVSDFNGKDPADLVRDSGGDAFVEVVNAAGDFMSFFIDKLSEENDAMTAEGRHKILSDVLPFIKQMSASDRDLYVRKLSVKLNTKEKFLYEEIDNFKLPTNHPARGREKTDSSKQKFSLPDEIFAIVLEYPVLFENFLKFLNENDFEDDQKAIYKAFSDQYNSPRAGNKKWNLDKGFLAGIRGKLDVLSLYASEKYSQLSEEAVVNEVEKIVDRYKKERRNKRLSEIQIKIAEAEKEEKKDELLKLLKEQQELLQPIKE